MNDCMYDCIIIGAGVNGGFIARTLAKYQLNILCLEKENDVGDETSGANSAIIHSGYDPHFGTLKAKLNKSGNELYDKICAELDVDLRRIGSLTVATTDEEVEKLYELQENAKKNGVDVTILDYDEVLMIEPFITKDVKKALLAQTAAIINPFTLCVSLFENAIDNGVELHLNEEVKAITSLGTYYQVQTDVNTYKTKLVINCAGVFADEINNMVSDVKEQIIPRKGEYYVLDHSPNNYLSHIIFGMPSEKGKGVLITPTTSNNYLIGPSSVFVEDKDDSSTNTPTLKNILEQASCLVDYIPHHLVIRQFAGLRAYHHSNDFVINMPKKNFINVLGMQSPGLASAPATALEVEKIVTNQLVCIKKDNFQPCIRPHVHFKDLDIAKQQQLYASDNRFGRVVCRCEKVTEAEVVDAIKRSCGATTIKGVKKRVRPGFGKCQGGFCEPNIIEILARELNKKPEEIEKNYRGSFVLSPRRKEGLSDE